MPERLRRRNGFQFYISERERFLAQTQQPQQEETK
jgi:hypothetical protein